MSVPRLAPSSVRTLLLLFSVLVLVGCSGERRAGPTAETDLGAGTTDLGGAEADLGGGPADLAGRDLGKDPRDADLPDGGAGDAGAPDLGGPDPDLGDLGPGDPCAPNPCRQPHRGVCQVQEGVAVCRCDPGYAEGPWAECQPSCAASVEACALASRSFQTLVSANGRAAVGYSLGNRRVNTFLEHPYQMWDEGVPSRDLLWDSYLGLRTAEVHRWLSDVPVVDAGYLAQSGILRVLSELDGLRIETLVWAPWELPRPAMGVGGRVTNPGATSRTFDLYTIHNYHLGHTTDADRVNPQADGEQIWTDAESGAYVEQGVGGTLVHWPLGAPTRRGCTPDNPYQRLQDGLELTDREAGGPGDDMVAGFSRTFTLAPGEQGLFGVVTAFDQGRDSAGLLHDLAAAYGEQDAAAALAAALAGWESWRRPPPPGLSPARLAIYRQQEAILRMGQVWEPGDRSRGQILASLPPGKWNISWPRDMAYSVVALARTGHLPEAQAALEFYLNAEVGEYGTYFGEIPYQISVCRYYGRGKEESDANGYGPNIEFDGFGLFLWALTEYALAGGDAEALVAWWPTVSAKVADALIALTDPETGLIVPDSSIWEVHWQGQQQQFTYTSLAAAQGLCGAGLVARQLGRDADAARYLAAGRDLRDAVRSQLVDPAGTLASSREQLQRGTDYRDAAVVEAFAWRLFDPAGDLAAASLAALHRDLTVAHGQGLFRNDDGGWYDQQEWILIDLRVAAAHRLAGAAEPADRLVDWVTAQALANFGLIAELHQAESARYDGAVPMVGFGAGAYVIALGEEAEPARVVDYCGGDEP